MIGLDDLCKKAEKVIPIFNVEWGTFQIKLDTFKLA